MFGKRFFLGFVLFLAFLKGVDARIRELEKPLEKTLVEMLAKKYPSFADVNGLKASLKKDLAHLSQSNPISAKIIANVFVANKTADVQDALNATSAGLFKQALQASTNLKRTDLELWVSTQYGFYLYTYRKYEETFPLFMSCINFLDHIDAETIISPCETYKKVGYFLMTVEDYEKAGEYLLKAKQYAEPNSAALAAITDNLGINSMKLNRLVEAEAYFEEARILAKNAKDELRYAKVLGNMATVKFKQKKYLPAIDLLKQDIAISQQVNNTQNTIFALVMLGKVYSANGAIEKAEEILRTAQVYAQSKTYLQSSDYEINTLILEIAKKTGNDKEELLARRRLEELKKTLTYLDGRDVITKVSWRLEKEKLQLSIEAEKAKREKETLLKILALAGCLVLLVMIVFVIRGYQKKIKTKETEYDEKLQRLNLDKEKSEQKLKVNRQTLQSYKTYLGEKNDQIKELEVEMAKIRESSTAYSEKYKNKIEALLNSHLLDNDTWVEFKSAFIQQHSSYYQNLAQNFKNLTDSNLRMIFLLKLEMNNAEIARILGLTLEGVKKSKQRLRKKYGEQYEALFN
ncbi:Tetratricopeptide repeat protein [compost metagenome]